MIDSAVKISDSSGRPVSSLGILHNVSDLRQVEEEQIRLGMAVEQAAESIMITDSDGTIVYVNPAFEQVSGYTREEAIGQNPRILNSGKQGAAFYGEMWETLKRGGTWAGHFINKHRDGRLYEEEAVISPVRDASNRVVNFVAVKRDVTLEMSLTHQLSQSQKMEAIGVLAGGVAHDFNNLLTVINGYSKMLMRDVDADSPIHQMAHEIHAAGVRAASLTRQLVAFSRKQTLQPEVLDLNTLVENMSKMLRRLIGEDVKLETSLAENLWPVQADPGQMEQVLMNLAVNARDAMPEGGHLKIETRNEELAERDCLEMRMNLPSGSYVMLSVWDTGLGMDRTTQERIFEPFFTTKEMGKGTGLGLSMVYGIVKQSGGGISVESELGRGSAFQVYLPCFAESSEPAPVLEDLKGKMGRGTETILVVEDEALVRQVIVCSLENLGYRVLEAQDGTEAIQVSGGNPGKIHLLVTDVVMPGMNGRELVERLREARPDTKVLMMSGYTDDAMVRHGVIHQEISFLQKPFGQEVLAQKVRQVLDEWQG